MQTYNQISQGNIMPLLMNFTTPTPIQETDDFQFTYSDKEQISYDMRTLGTRSLKQNFTHQNGAKKNDGKSNQIDDTKTVR